MLWRGDEPVTSRGGDFASRLVDGPRRPLIAPPYDLLVQREGSAVRLAAIDRGRVISSGELSGATKYLFFWVAQMDASTQEGRLAGKARAVLVGSIPRTYVDRQALYGPLLTDAKLGSGFFLCSGADDEGNEGRFIVSTEQDGAILDGALPGNVTDLQISESGEPANDTTLSLLAFTYVAPRPLGAFSAIQPAIRDYPAVGDLTFFGPLDYSGAGGGAGGGLLRIIPARRTGNGTISIAGTAVTGVGTTFTQFAQADDQIEMFGTRRRILTVNSDTSITLTAVWPASPAVIGVEHYVVIGKCRVYAIALSEAFTHDQNQANWPFKDVDLDGELSAPNAPATLILTPYGNGIRGQFVQVAGLGIRGYAVFRSTGSTDDLTTATQIGKEIRHDPTTPNGGTVLQFEDTNFSVHEREEGQVFRYYARTLNVRGESSSGYATAIASCRLDSPSDLTPVVPGITSKNLLFNGFISGTTGGGVSAADVSQDTYMGGAPGAGHARWQARTVGGTITGAGHQSQTEVLLHSAVGGPGSERDEIYQRIGGWGNSTAANRRIDRGQHVTLSVHARTSGGQPNGSFSLSIGMLDNAFAQCAIYSVRARLADDTLDWSGNAVSIPGSSMTTDDQMYFGTFSPDVGPTEFTVTGATNATPIVITTSAAHLMTTGQRVRVYGVLGNTAANGSFIITVLSGTTFSLNGSVGSGAYTSGGKAYVEVAWVEVRLVHQDSTNGVNIVVTKVMLNFGDTVALFTPEMIDAVIAFPSPDPGVPVAGPFRDGDGHRDGIIGIEVP